MDRPTTTNACAVRRIFRNAPHATRPLSRWLRLALLAAAPSGLVCGGAPGTPGSPAPVEAPIELLQREAPGAAETLAFPPESGRRPRPVLEKGLGVRKDSSEVEIVEPVVDGSGRFEVVGRTLRVSFNQPIALPAAPAGAKHGGFPRAAAPGTLRLRPEVEGDARWLDALTLEFTAARQMERDTVYEVAIPHLAASSGKVREGGWEARFTATPSEAVAGKELGYVPEPGVLRTIAAYPADHGRLRRGAELSVLYDQPVDLAVARSLIELHDDAGRRVPVVLDHPRSKSFQGVRVDPRYVVLIRPVAPLAPGQNVQLVARDRATGAAGKQREVKYKVADALTQVDLACGYRWDNAPCPVDTRGATPTIKPSERQVHVVFNNPIDLWGKALERAVQVTPRVRNLSVRSESWDGSRIVLSGGFEPSTRYSVFIAGLKDRYDNRLAAPVQFHIETQPLGASASMPEGLLLMDQEAAKRFVITTRNVAEAEILAWPVPRDDARGFQDALDAARARRLPDGEAPIKIPVAIKGERRDKLVETEVDVSTKLPGGASYLATLRAAKLTHGSAPAAFPRGSEAERPSVALLRRGSASAITVHSREVPGATLVQLSRLGDGEPVAGAGVQLEGEPGVEKAPPAATTDAHGVALLPGAPGGKIRVDVGGAATWVPLGERAATARQLFPDLAAGNDDGDGEAAGARRAMVITDRGIYRPGSTVWIKASVRRPEGARLAPAASAPVRLRVVGPTGDDAYSELCTTNDMGSCASRFEIPGDAKVGRHELRVEDPDHADPPLAQAIVQVAEFEAPRFAVDVDAAGGGSGRLKALIRGRYLFGAPMDGGAVRWTLRREPAAFPSGPLTDAGLVFRPRRSWHDDDRAPAWTRAGEAKLGPDGTLAVEQALNLDGAEGPQTFTLEADVSDTSHRHIAARSSVLEHPSRRYAGLRAGASWVSVGAPVPLELGVIDTAGQPVVGARMIARMERIDWRYSRRRGAGGADRWTWTSSRTEVGRCTLKSERTPARCELRPPRSGDYEITAEVDGKRGGAATVWAWREGDSERVASPSRGRTVEIVTDKARYAPGEKAKLLVRSPYQEATALLTLEQGGLLEHRASRVKGGAAVLEVPLTATHAPFVHASVTLLPIREKGEARADYRVGAVRLPVSLAGARLDVAIQSDKPSYSPGEEAEITLLARDGAAPRENAEIALAVVDEGVLRMTNFRAADPAEALRPGRPLWFRVRDSRDALAALLDRSHVAGDGGGPEMGTIDRTRKDFVETALWRPDLRTDAAGRVSVKFRLPDNLTQFRVMAVALDADGKGAAAESDFTVRKPLMIVPVVPRFALRGDRLEVAAMVHNNMESPVAATVQLGDRQTTVTVSGGGHSRVAFPFAAEAVGERSLSFAVADGSGKVRDRVEAKLRVDEPGFEERPRLSGSFAGTQEIALAIPASIDTGGRSLRVQAGRSLWPELGARLEYLLGYPHGCVEQTTSSTLPLLAAREILPRIGIAKMSERALDTRIKAGLARLASMRTDGGGLAYWPGGDDTNVYGTAYAMRAVVLAKAAGVEGPKGLLEGMKAYLTGELLSRSTPPEVKAAIAQSLGELGELPPSAADALLDTRPDQSVFGKASLAIALSTLKGHDDQVAALLDDVEGAFDAEGRLTQPPGAKDFYYFGSATRSRAQAAMALSRLRRGARVLPGLLRELATETEAYTTQATAYALLAVATQLSATGGVVAEAAPPRVWLDGKEVTASRDLGHGSKEFTIPLSALRGKQATLRLASDGPAAVGFQVSASWYRPLKGDESVAATRGAKGPSLYRVFTDAKGGAIDLSKVRAGDVIRVALLARLPVGEIDRKRLGYVALTDRLPAGFEPIQPELATVARAPDMDGSHPFASMLADSSAEASHIEMRDDRVNLYFDRLWDDHVVATYLVRASTPGEFSLPPAMAEMMYEGDGVGYSEAGRVTVQ